PPTTSTLRRYRPLCELPSFPTRRSSDLHLHVYRGRDVHEGGRAAHPAPVRLPLDPGLERPAGVGAACRVRPVPGRYAVLADGRRAEEHTSELQSRENLVCRLLLEKKKLT